ncbi:MAG: hypothetical protein RMK29_17115 [Myxococcales bacterium]|nr:hypothetical protein [Myxococcota bacterium]MDW8283430.1 hypothetical protein [Myxococcales bacterium]
MKRSVHHLALVGLPILLSAPPVHALVTARSYDLRIEGTPVGTMTFRQRVTEDNWGTVCQYTGRWTNLGGTLRRTRLCRLNEYKAGEHLDCEENRRTFFSTLVVVSEGGCSGFDEFGQATLIRGLAAGQSPQGQLFGIIVTESVGDVQSFEMSVRPASEGTPALVPQAAQGIRLPAGGMMQMPVQVLP